MTFQLVRIPTLHSWSQYDFLINQYQTLQKFITLLLTSHSETKIFIERLSCNVDGGYRLNSEIEFISSLELSVEANWNQTLNE